MKKNKNSLKKFDYLHEFFIFVFMRNSACLFFLIALWSLSLPAQLANDTVPAYDGIYRYGSNTSGRDGNWVDVTMANIAAGNEALGLAGAGVKSFRTALPEHFLESWGYGIRVAEFDHYATLNMQDHTVFMEGPLPAHRDSTMYCPGLPSDLFKNLYAPIWDGGANGTPYNDTNYYAAYVHQMVDVYKDYVHFWEVMNEPDFTSTSNGWQAPGVAGNWWDAPPDPCDLDNMHAPIFHYVRMLRISYEVIKSLDPDAFVAVGGLGYPSFLDAILRYTDNPGAGDGGVGAAGSVTPDYPHTGGVYFDCMSLHSYPQYSNRVNGTPKQRHSDAAAWGDIDKKVDFEAVLHAYGYDGATYPEKVYIITETNIPRAKFGDYIGGNEVQRNYLIKSSVLCQMNDIRQMYIFSLDDRDPVATATAPHDLMGLFLDLATTPDPYDQVANDLAIANLTQSTLLLGTIFDSAETRRLALPPDVMGAAFQQPDGVKVYVLWARTNLDEDETANATYSFPPSAGLIAVERFAWDHGRTGLSSVEGSLGLALTGAPSFFKKSDGVVLAADWKSLEATVTFDQTVQLTWGNDRNFLGGQFVVQRASRDMNFTNIGTINAVEYTAENEKYTFYDLDPEHGTQFYRIHHQAPGGNHAYSPTVEVRLPAPPQGVHVWPNPLHPGEVLHLQAGGKGHGSLLDMNGKVVMTFELDEKNEKKMISLEEKSIKSGIYFVKLTIDGKPFVQKLVILNN